jgi:hypothetical protein
MKTGPNRPNPTVPADRPTVEPSAERLLTRNQTLRALQHTISAKKFAELLAKKLIPEIRLGHRTRRYRLSSVHKALAALESEVEA